MILRNARPFSDFIGIPYGDENNQDPDRLNCWQICERIMVECFGVQPPTYDYQGEFKKVESCFVENLSQWDEVLLEDRQPGDLVLLSIAGHPIHLGILIYRNIMVHTLDSVGSCTEDITRVSWQKRIKGFYRWRSPNS